MNKTAFFIGRTVIAALLALFLTAVTIGLVDLTSTLWRAVWPEYRSYVVGTVSAIYMWLAQKLVKQEGAAP